jgi:hypothetical protein
LTELTLVVVLGVAACTIAGLQVWIARTLRAEAKATRTAVDALRAELAGAGRAVPSRSEQRAVEPSGGPRLVVTRPTRYRGGDDQWYEIEVLVSNLGDRPTDGVTVTPFIDGRPVAAATPSRSVPPGRAVSFLPRIPRRRLLQGTLSLHATDGRIEAWWRGPSA